jgi:hypothetical protein
MRHSTITLAMDTYGHLFPGQEAGAVAQMRQMLIDDTPEELRATGTDDGDAASGAAVGMRNGAFWVRWSAR